jgi:Trypsin-like peptidase domain/TPR repeat/Tetratricopeptide repeat
MAHSRWYWIAIYSASLLLTSCGSPKKLPEAIKTESSKSIVLVSHLKGHGSGFFIEGAAGVCTVLTVKHAVPEGKAISIHTMDSKIPFKPQKIQRWNNADLAVVTFKPLDGICPFPTLKLGDSNNVVLAQLIYISSYSGGINGQSPARSFYITSINDRTVGSDGYEIGYKADTLGGTSGSPVLNEFGEVIAVHGRSYLVDKSSNPLVSDRAYLDLGIPINLYKKDSITKIEVQNSVAQKSSISKTTNSDLKPHIDWDWSNLIWKIVNIVILFYAFLLSIGISRMVNDKFEYRYRPIGLICGCISQLFFTAGIIWIIDYNNKNFRSQTIAQYDNLIRDNPNYSDAYFYRASAKLRVGNKEGAISDYNKVIQLEPSRTDAYTAKDSVNLNSGNKKEPTDNNKVTQLQHTARIYRDKAKIQASLGEEEAAIANYSKAIGFDPRYPYTYYERGNAKSVLGDKKGAKTDYQKAAELFLKEGNKKSYNNALYAIKKLGI